MKRWLLVLWALAGVGAGLTILFGTALNEQLPSAITQEEYATVDWPWVLVLDGILIPAAGTLLVAAGLALLAYYAAAWTAAHRSAGDAHEQG